MALLAATSRSRIFHLVFFLLILFVSSSSSQELELKSRKNTSVESTRPLDRRCKMFLRVLKKVSDGGEGVLDLGDAGLGLFDAFFVSLSMILVSEIGDETFIIAALMAMRHPKSIVLSGIVNWTRILGIGGETIDEWSTKENERGRELDEEDKEKKLCANDNVVDSATNRTLIPTISSSSSLATHKKAIGVTVGATLGHTICTSVAVVGGSMLASKISQGTVATIGGLLILGVSVIILLLSSCN